MVEAVADAARWNGAQLLMVVGPDVVPADGLPPDAIVFEAPADDPDGVFATLVGTFAAALDDGADAGGGVPLVAAGGGLDRVGSGLTRTASGGRPERLDQGWAVLSNVVDQHD